MIVVRARGLRRAFAAASVAGCKAPVDKWLALGKKLGISATPVTYVASGARIIVTLLHALKAKGLKKGLATLCIGGGEATAMAFEMV